MLGLHFRYSGLYRKVLIRDPICRPPVESWITECTAYCQVVLRWIAFCIVTSGHLIIKISKRAKLQSIDSGARPKHRSYNLPVHLQLRWHIHRQNRSVPRSADWKARVGKDNETSGSSFALTESEHGKPGHHVTFGHQNDSNQACQAIPRNLNPRLLAFCKVLSINRLKPLPCARELLNHNEYPPWH